MRFKIFLVLFFFVSLLLIETHSSAIGSMVKDLHFDAFKTIPIQHGGRLKPLDTFSREVVQAVTGKVIWQNIEAIDLIFSWMILPEKWAQASIIEISSQEFKKTFELPVHQKYFSVIELLHVAALTEAFGVVQEKNKKEEKLSSFEKAVERVSMQIQILDAVSRGNLLTIIPNPKGISENWFSISDLFSSSLSIQIYEDIELRSKSDELKVTLHGFFQSYRDNDLKTFGLTSEKLKQLLSEFSPIAGYPYVATLSTELFYNQFRPFRKAWMVYVLSFVLFILYFLSKGKYLWGVGGLAFAFVGFLLHLFGFYLRCSITGRPPVGTMYESVIWVSLGVVFFSLLLFMFYKRIVIVASASVIAAFGLILADHLPVVLDSTIRPLVPVLRSNFWLTIHVLTITLSYAAFALAMGMGNWGVLKLFLITDRKEEIKHLLSCIYRSIQIGILLLAAGTILGGVWADYSWGRFWGWDPKEVWALIALLFYLAIIHAKYAGWLKEFGLLAFSILAFQGVLMAWYGVNFVLGVGLHSYGFGKGGLLYVLMYGVLQILFVTIGWLRYRYLNAKF